MKITVTLTIPREHNICFFDVCHAAASALRDLGQEVLDNDSDLDTLVGTSIDVVTETDDPETVGQIKVR
jgi:hypothetical protein